MTTETEGPAARLLNSRRSVVQLAYAVDDVYAASERWLGCGAGPFFVAEHVALESASHRGRPSRYDHSMSLGAWGDVMIELICVHDAEPPALRHAVSVEGGLHHVAVFVEDLHAEGQRLEASGWPSVLNARAISGTRFAFHRSAETRHLLEIYEPRGAIAAVYRSVMGASAGWDGTNPIRSF